MKSNSQKNISEATNKKIAKNGIKIRLPSREKREIGIPHPIKIGKLTQVRKSCKSIKLMSHLFICETIKRILFKNCSNIIEQQILSIML